MNRKRIGVYQALQSYLRYTGSNTIFFTTEMRPIPTSENSWLQSDMKCVVERKTILHVYVAHINDLILYSITETMPFIILFNVWFINFEEIFCRTQCVFEGR